MVIELNDTSFETGAGAAAEQPDEARGIARATALIALGNVTSRALGLARESLLASLFGAGATVSALRVAVLIPRNIFDLLVGGHASSALVPVFSEYAGRHGRAALWELASAVLSLATAALAALVLVMELCAPQLVYLVNSGASAEGQALATDMLRTTAPAVLFLSLATVVSGLLYALKRFTLPAFAGAVFNGALVVTTLLLADVLDIGAMALGWLTGAVVQVIFQLPALRDARLRLTFAWRHPGLRRIFSLYVPVMASLLMDVLILRPASYNLASHTGPSSISWMEYATQLNQLPQGLVATAISIAILPTLARQAASANGAYKATLGHGLRLVMLLIIPAAVGLFVLAAPVIDLVYESDAFLPHDTMITALVLRLYVIGLPFAALDLLLVYAFYAQQDTLTPAAVGAISLVVYMIVAVMLIGPASLFSLMIADTVKHITHAGICGYLLWRRTGGLAGQRLPGTAARALLAALAMGGVVWGAMHLAGDRLGSDGLAAEALVAAIPAALGVVTYTGLLLAVGGRALLHIGAEKQTSAQR
ncbi:MAG: murein biosynthesis integral membrane protein MurJ [Anaerolineae bacterium]|nr:murein biosynthesis integral membrane protein MurJ [Anaerolineae bacterium]